jgi:hypothetical protein
MKYGGSGEKNPQEVIEASVAVRETAAEEHQNRSKAGERPSEISDVAKNALRVELAQKLNKVVEKHQRDARRFRSSIGYDYSYIDQNNDKFGKIIDKYLIEHPEYPDILDDMPEGWNHGAFQITFLRKKEAAKQAREVVMLHNLEHPVLYGRTQ